MRREGDALNGGVPSVVAERRRSPAPPLRLGFLMPLQVHVVSSIVPYSTKALPSALITPVVAHLNWPMLLYSPPSANDPVNG